MKRRWSCRFDLANHEGSAHKLTLKREEFNGKLWLSGSQLQSTVRRIEVRFGAPFLMGRPSIFKEKIGTLSM